MGQKTNPNILRLGVIKHWKTEFFEKKTKELSKYTLKDLELKNYTERFLSSNGLFLHDYRQKFSNSSLILYLSYFITPNFFEKTKFKKNLVKLLLKNSNGEKKTIIKNFNFYYKKPQRTSKPFFVSYKSKIPITKTHKYLISNYYSKFLLLKHFNYNEKTDLEGIFLNFLKTINLFTYNNYNIILNVFCLNKGLKLITTKHNIKQLTLKLKRFKNTEFFKNGFELLLNSITNKNSAGLLAKFVANQIKKDKKHKFFLSFLKKILTPLLNSNISILKGIKIKIKGRLNGAPKAKKKIITIGDVPAQSINSFIDYEHCAVHNKNGTYGIKIWTALK